MTLQVTEMESKSFLSRHAPWKMTTGHPVGPRGQDTDHLHTNLRHLNQQKSVQILGKSVLHCPVTADYWCIKLLQHVIVFVFRHPVLGINNSLDTSTKNCLCPLSFFLISKFNIGVK